MYRGRHRKSARSGRRARAAMVALVLVAGLGALAPTVALGEARPKGCTGLAPTAVTIQQTLSGPDGSPAVTFTYAVVRDESVVATRTLIVAPGQTASTTVGGLRPGSYAVQQQPDPNSGVAPADDAPAVIDPPACAPTVTFTSLLTPA